MIKPKLTPWYPPSIKPHWIGVYNASTCSAEDELRWWNGRYWSLSWCAGWDYVLTDLRSSKKSMHQKRIYWRGLDRP